MKYKALDPEVNLKTRYEEIEDLASYADSLSEEDKDWLNRFAQEYVCANFNHKGETLHDTKEMRKTCYDRNNARNRCIYTKEKAQGAMNYLEDIRSIENKMEKNLEPKQNTDIDLTKEPLI